MTWLRLVRSRTPARAVKPSSSLWFYFVLHHAQPDLKTVFLVPEISSAKPADLVCTRDFIAALCNTRARAVYSYPPTVPIDCADCHSLYQNYVGAVDSYPPTVPIDCADCHSLYQNYVGAVYSYPPTVPIDCADCHSLYQNYVGAVDSYPPTVPIDCADCHSLYQNYVGAVDSYPPTVPIDCADCHSLYQAELFAGAGNTAGELTGNGKTLASPESNIGHRVTRLVTGHWLPTKILTAPSAMVGRQTDEPFSRQLTSTVDQEMLLVTLIKANSGVTIQRRQDVFAATSSYQPSALDLAASSACLALSFRPPSVSGWARQKPQLPDLRVSRARQDRNRSFPTIKTKDSLSSICGIPPSTPRCTDFYS
ncbi:hypothetical protein RRG08_021231 [Elysia crispata]|uniref:Uncharacterized protein n=1 Tax=Elysia crispata TaxID=231223 RepID=A0AAE1D6K0_9GAST|nr:hypothetical protein RRG08_021231 [Elysia crispata]